jgi:hypothetical protein
MDPHFNEYLAAIAGMNETYGERTDDHPSEFHADECHPSSLHDDRGVLTAGTASGVASAT